MSFDIGASKEFEVHMTVFSHDVWGLENLCNLDKVPARGATVRDYFHRVTFGKMGITEAVTREMAKAHAQYQALLNDRSAAVILTSLKVTSGANGFKVMDPFDWTKDKAIYQRW